MTRFQRLHESAVFKTLGATTRTLAAMLAIEYSALGALAGTIGAAGRWRSPWALLPVRARRPVVGDARDVVLPGLLLTALAGRGRSAWRPAWTCCGASRSRILRAE